MAVCVKLVIIIAPFILYKKDVIVPSLMNYTAENASYSTPNI